MNSNQPLSRRLAGVRDFLLARHSAWTVALVIAWMFGPVALAGPVTLPGVLHQYSFDDASGVIAADSIGSNQATLQNFGGGNSQWISGMFGGGVNYTNENAYVISNLPIAASSASQFTVSFWSRLNSKPNSNDSVLVTPQADNWITYNPTGNTNGSGKQGIGLKSVREASQPLIGVWEHYAVTFDRTTGGTAVYQNGALVDSGLATLPSLNTKWVFGHNQDPGNTNGSWHGALDEIQIYDRVLAPAEVSALATRPVQEGISAQLVVAEHRFGSQPTGQYATTSTTLYLDPAQVDWLAWNRFEDLRAVSDSRPGELFLGSYTPEVDDFFYLAVTNPLGQTMVVSMDRNGSLGAPTGQQSVIFGSAAAAPDVVRGDNFGTPTFFDEAGAFNAIFTVPGNYQFSFAFQNIGGEAGYPDVYLLTHTVPEPGTLALAGIGLVLGGLSAARRTRRKS